MFQALYQIDESTETGTCATAIKDNDRSLVANLAAANNYKVSSPSLTTLVTCSHFFLLLVDCLALIN